MTNLYVRLELINTYPLTDAYKVIQAINDIIITIPQEFNVTGKISFVFTDWIKVNDVYYALMAFVDLNKKCLEGINVVDGYYDIQSNTYVVGDGFLEINYDEININMAIQDIMDGTIPLINYVKIEDIDVEKYPYVNLTNSFIE